MTNIQIAIEQFKRIPLLDRPSHIERMRLELDLSLDQIRECFWKAEGWSDEKISQEKERLKSEFEMKALMDFMNNLSTRNPEGNVPFGDPRSNLITLAQVAQLKTGGKTLQDAFMEVFGRDKYESVIKEATQT